MAELQLNIAYEIVDVGHITDVAPVNKLFHDVLAQERAIQVELESRLRHRKKMEAELLSLTASMTDVLQLGHTEAQELASTVHATASEAQEVSQRVRRLDNAQNNLMSTIDRIRRALDSGTCITAVQSALDSQDYEAAAANISRYQQLQEQSPNGNALPRGSPGSTYADHVVGQARDKLLVVVREKIAAACESRDMQGVLRFLRLYKPLNVPQEGMAAALAFVRSSTQQQADEVFAELGTAKEPSYIGTMAKTLKSIHTAVKENQVVIIEAFGPAHVLELAKDVSLALDEKIPRIVAAFMKARNVSALLSSIRNTAGPHQFDAVAADALLNELRQLLACVHEFLAFLSRTAASAVHPKPVPREIAEIMADGDHTRSIKDLQGAYTSLEAAYVHSSVSKALEWDQVLQGAMMSSMLDDTFFVLRSAAKRALMTSSWKCFVETLSVIVEQLRGTFKEALARKLSGCTAAIINCFKDDSVPSQADVESAAAPLNNVVQSTTYAARMHESLEAQAMQRFTTASEVESVRSALDELQQAGAALQELCIRFCESLNDTFVQQLLSQPMSALQRATYELKEAQYSSRELELGWASPLCASLQYYWDLITPGLAAEAQQEVSRSLISRLLYRIEGVLKVKKFTALGGLLLDRDVRALSTGLAEVTEQPVRERFARLNQVVEILTLETLSDVMELWNDGAITWRINASEIRQVLSWRTDFDRAEVSSLQF